MFYCVQWLHFARLFVLLLTELAIASKKGSEMIAMKSQTGLLGIMLGLDART